MSAGPGQSLFILSVLMSRLSSAVDTSPSLVTHNGDEEEYWKNLQSFLTIFLLNLLSVFKFTYLQIVNAVVTLLVL